MGIFLVVTGLLLLGGFILYSAIHFVSFSVNYVVHIGWVTDEWFTVDNGWAWFLMLIALLLTAAVLKVVFSFVRAVLLGLGMWLGTLLPVGRVAGMTFGFVFMRSVVFLIAVGLSIWGTISMFSYTTANPGLTEYFVEGNWFAGLYVFLIALGLLYPMRSEKN